MSNSLDPDQARRIVGPDLGPNCLPRLSADDTGRQRVHVMFIHLDTLGLNNELTMYIFLCSLLKRDIYVSFSVSGRSWFIQCMQIEVKAWQSLYFVTLSSV